MLEDLEWANILGCKLTLDMEMLHALEWGHSEIDKISHTKIDRPPLGICITLLAGLGYLQTVTDKLNLLFSFTNDIWSKHLAFSGF
jgi:hypothetical protein